MSFVRSLATVRPLLVGRGQLGALSGGLRASGAGTVRPSHRRQIQLASEGPWVFEDDMSVTKAKNLDATLQSYLPVKNGRAAGQATTPGMHLLYFNHSYPESQLGEDGYDDSQAPIGDFPNRRWYGGSIEYNNNTSLKLGLPGTCTETVSEMRESHGGKRVNVTIDRRMGNDGDAEGWAVRERRSMFYFGHEPAVLERQFSRHFEPKYKAKYEHLVNPTRVLLFRYSALNFNSHLIHYDSIYSRETENLPDVLVQGPLMVTMMLWWFSSSVLQGSDRQIKLFTYRNLAPLTVADTMRLCATPIMQDSMEVWIENSKGSVVLSGTIVMT